MQAVSAVMMDTSMVDQHPTGHLYNSIVVQGTSLNKPSTITVVPQCATAIGATPTPLLYYDSRVV
jgi:hypothetical protein